MCPVATVISPGFLELGIRTLRSRVCIFDSLSDPVPDAFDPLPMWAYKLIGAINASVQDSYSDPSLTTFMVLPDGPDTFLFEFFQMVKEFACVL